MYKRQGVNGGLVDTQLLSAGPFLHALLLLGHNGFRKPAQLRHLFRGRGVERMIFCLSDTGVFHLIAARS